MFTQKKPYSHIIFSLHLYIHSQIITTGHVEVEPPVSPVLLSEHHLLVGRQIKKYLHQLGLHSSTVQIEYLDCPPGQGTVTEPQCHVNTCCLNDDDTLEHFAIKVIHSNTL